MDEPEQELHYKYNGSEKVGDHGLGLYMAAYRTLDPALGRWCSVDPKGEGAFAHSPYNSMFNNLISMSDPEGYFAFLAALGYAAISVTINGIINEAKGSGFFAGGP